MDRNHNLQHQQPYDFFNVSSQNEPLNREKHICYKALQKKSSSSTNILVSTELSLSSSLSSSSPSTKTFKSPNQTHHQYFSTIRKTKTSSKSSYNDNNYSNHKSGNMSHNSPSSNSFTTTNTTLKLYDDPWKIKKVLTASDLGKLNRLLLSSEDSVEDLVDSLVRINNDDDDDNDDENRDELFIAGKEVRVWDVDTKSMHQLILKKWASFKNYVLIGDWNQDFVKRRNLKRGDEIGLQWDPYNFCFNFSILKRSFQ